MIETRVYPVEPLLKDRPPQGIALAAVVVEPKELKLEGPQSQLDKIEKLVTEPISLSELSADKKVTRFVEILPTTVLLPKKELPKVTVTLTVRKTKEVDRMVLPDESPGEPKQDGREKPG